MFKIEADNAIHFELGKITWPKTIKKAYSSFERATQIDPTNKWFG
jgi:hypothetical protein